MEDRSNYWLRRRVSRRTTLKGGALAGVGAAGLALVGCGDDDDGGPEPTRPGLINTPLPSPTVAEQAQPGGAASMHISSSPPSLDPYTQTSFLNSYMNGLTYSKLLRYKAGVPEVAPTDFTMEPDLAQAMPEQPDQLTLVFKLKPAKWHNVPPMNGRALTSEDVKYAMERYKTFDASVHKSLHAWWSSVETPDAQTVRFKMATPYADSVQILGGNLGAYISPKEHAETDAAKTLMAGSGPFINTEYQTGTKLEFRKNPDYYDQPYPYFDNFSVFITPDTERRVADFSSKQVTFSWLFLPDQRDRLKRERPDAQFEETQGIGGYIYLRTDRPPFNDKRVRQAISMGINRKAIRDAISKGEGVPDQIVFVGYPFARQVADLGEPAKYWEYNPTEARKLLDAALGAGKTIETTWDRADAAVYTQAYVDTATLAQAQLRQIGINITDQQAPYAQYISTTYQGQYEGMGHSPRAVFYFLDYLSERLSFKDGKRARINLSYVNNPALEALLDKQRSDFNIETRLQTIKEIESLCAEEQYEIYFSTDTRTYFWDPDIRNHRPTAWFPYTHMMKAWRKRA
jgi:peptide/nickel transport system substrate-binding protein